MTEVSSPAISLIIPTRERAETLGFTLRTAVDQDAQSYEIVVSDNCSQDATADVVRGLKDPRIRYLVTDRRLSMCDNWEFALQAARGDYVIFIGDDDAVAPQGIARLLNLIRTHPSEAYRWRPPIYTWPIESRNPFVQWLPALTPVQEIDLREMARFTIRHGGWKYYELPGAYHAAVARRIFDRIRSRTGRVFHTTQPDLFTSMSVPAFVSKGIHTGVPITIAGISAKSNGAAAVCTKGQDNVARFVREFGDYRIHRTLYPGIPIQANLIVDAILVSFEMFPECYGDLRFNYEAMWAFLYKINHVTKRQVLAHRKEIRAYHPFSTPKFLWHATLQDGAKLRRKILNRFEIRGSFMRDLPTDIEAFAQLLSRSMNPSN